MTGSREAQDANGEAIRRGDIVEDIETPDTYLVVSGISALHPDEFLIEPLDMTVGEANGGKYDDATVVECRYQSDILQGQKRMYHFPSTRLRVVDAEDLPEGREYEILVLVAGKL